MNILEETKLHTINWEIITKHIPKKNIDFIDFQIVGNEKNPELIAQIEKAANLLNDMLLN